MGKYRMEYKVGGERRLCMESLDDESYEDFRANCVLLIHEYEKLCPEDRRHGHASISDDWTTRQIW